MRKLLRSVVPIFLFGNIAFAQGVITGVVKDPEGGTVIGANIGIKNTQVATATDANGQFRLTVQQELPVTLRVSSVGFKTQEIEVYELDNEPLEITLILDNLLDQIVVTSRRREETAQEVPIAV